MKAKIGNSGELVGKYCPRDTKERCCGTWCPLFVEESDINIVSIYCGCAPVVFEIVEDERNK